MNTSERNGEAALTGCRLKSSAGLKPRACGFKSPSVCPLETVEFHRYMPLPRPGCMADKIAIPVAARAMPISSYAMSSRLQNVLGWKECRTLGDLEGLRFSEVGRWRNCGKRTLLELLGIIRCVQHRNWEAHCQPYTWKMAGDYEV